ncbi:helix-turn-helix domain-containing protein [uncultured Maribacter sp.]|uniref:helix-turn-helix domain-containing protein n=1 Tax=uncultured Maribacter sp. TaxID=431308 RepID=UPI0030DD6674|tara:strand:- start:3067 stop:3528 length:462 start_codon:yes stop_codon:yes gene_type:complete
MENNPFKTINDKLDKLQYSFDELQNNSDKVSFEPDLLNVKQASEFLNQAEGTLYNNALKGTIPSYKKFGKRYFLKSELLEWIKKGKHKAHEELTDEVNNTLQGQKKKTKTQKQIEQIAQHNKKKGQRSKELLNAPSKEQNKDTDFSNIEKGEE